MFTDLLSLSSDFRDQQMGRVQKMEMVRNLIVNLRNAGRCIETRNNFVFLLQNLIERMGTTVRL